MAFAPRKPSFTGRVNWVLTQHCRDLARRVEQLPCVTVLACLLGIEEADLPEPTYGTRLTPAGPDPEMAAFLYTEWSSPEVKRLLATLKTWETEQSRENRF